MARDLLPYGVLLILLLLGIYVYSLAVRSRESELARALRKSEIALQDSERTLQNAAAVHAEEIRRLTVRLNEPGDAAGGGGSKFRRAKSAFARLFHPDAAGGDAKERQIRSEMFKQFWDELERIERGR